MSSSFGCVSSVDSVSDGSVDLWCYFCHLQIVVVRTDDDSWITEWIFGFTTTSNKIEAIMFFHSIFVIYKLLVVSANDCDLRWPVVFCPELSEPGIAAIHLRGESQKGV